MKILRPKVDIDRLRKIISLDGEEFVSTINSEGITSDDIHQKIERMIEKKESEVSPALKNHSKVYTRNNLGWGDLCLTDAEYDRKTDPFMVEHLDLEIDEIVKSMVFENSIDSGVPQGMQDQFFNNPDPQLLLIRISFLEEYLQSLLKEGTQDDPTMMLEKDVKKLISKARKSLTTLECSRNSEEAQLLISKTK